MIEESIADRAFAEGWVEPHPPDVRTGKRVAVVGSGPAGLATAAEITRAGHEVTVFERSDRIGGLLMYGIPNMKLDKKLVDRRVKLLAEEGVRFVTGTEIGKDLPAGKLLEDFEAVVLCGGATQARDLPVEGRTLNGIYPAMEFLTANTKSLLDSRHADGKYISAKGKHVIVIGGGDTGTDCVGTAIRHGARSITQLEIMPRPPDMRDADNPCPQWPKVYRLDYGQDEAKALWGKDPRVYAVMTKRFLADDKRNVQELMLVDVEWVRGPDGRYGPREIPGTDRVIPAELVLLAMGFIGPEKPLLQQLGVKLDERGNVWTDQTRMTSVPGVFAAGDMARGQSLVGWAIREGRLAAQQGDRYLSYGETGLPRCGSPDRSVSNDLPPSRVRVTTSAPSTGTRTSSLMAGTNHAVSGSRGCTATAKPKEEGLILISFQLFAPSVERNTPLWCCAQSTSGDPAQRTIRWGSWTTGSSARSGGM